MDIVGKEALESMLMKYEGTVLFVSHDRYFIQKIADSLLIYEKDKVYYYPYGYQEYTERANLSVQTEASAKACRSIKCFQSSNTWKKGG